MKFDDKTLVQKLLNIQSRIVAISKSSDNPFFKSRYADLNSVLQVVKPLVNEEQIVIANSSGADSNGRYLETSLINASDGQSITSRKYFSGNEKNMQELGAADTYARRFNLTNLLSLETTDDDGETAVGHGNQTATRSNSTKAVGNIAKARITSDIGHPDKENDTNIGYASDKGKPAVQQKSGPSRKTLLEKISLTSKVIVDSKRDTQENIVKLLATFNVKTKEELTDEQAKQLLTQLEGKLK